MFKSTLVLLLAVSRLYASAVLAENAAHPMVTRHASINLTSRGLTHNPAAAIEFYPYGDTACQGSVPALGYPDGICFEVYDSGSLTIDEFFGVCNHGKFINCTNLVVGKGDGTSSWKRVLLTQGYKQCRSSVIPTVLEVTLRTLGLPKHAGKLKLENRFRYSASFGGRHSSLNIGCLVCLESGKHVTDGLSKQIY